MLKFDRIVKKKKNSKVLRRYSMFMSYSGPTFGTQMSRSAISDSKFASFDTMKIIAGTNEARIKIFSMSITESDEQTIGLKNNA